MSCFGGSSEQAICDRSFRQNGIRAVFGCPCPTAWNHAGETLRTFQGQPGEREDCLCCLVGEQVIKSNPGKVVATPVALAALEASGESLLTYLHRHIAGDWGDLDAEDAQGNELSLKHGWRLLSAYSLKSGTKIWVITE